MRRCRQAEAKQARRVLTIHMADIELNGSLILSLNQAVRRRTVREERVMNRVMSIRLSNTTACAGEPFTGDVQVDVDALRIVHTSS